MKYVIDSNPSLQIRVQLYANNMVDSMSNGIPFHDKWITGGNIPCPFINDPGIASDLIYKGSTLLVHRFGTAELYIAQTPSTFSGRPFCEWRVTLPSTPLRLAFDPYSDLLVTVERTSEPFKMALIMRKLTDGTPLRVTNRIDLPKETMHEKLSIYGRYVALEWTNRFTNDNKLEVWEWKTGYPVVFPDPPDSVNVKTPFVFLSHRYILTGEVNMDYNRCAELNIVDVHTVSKNIVCHLRLPKFAYSRPPRGPKINISVDDRPPQLTATPEDIFITSSEPQDKVVRVTLEENDERAELYILTSTLLKWARQRTGPIKWENWGANNTRLISFKAYPSPTVAIYGTRVFFAQDSTLTIYDFNQRPIDLESAQMADVHLNTVTHTTDVFNPSGMFEQPVTTCLPFRWMTIDVEKLMPEMAANLQLYPGEDNIVCVSGRTVRYVRM